jgi:hypothetical protein
MTAHMGMFEVKDQVYGFMGISPAADRIRGLSPFP